MSMLDWLQRSRTSNGDAGDIKFAKGEEVFHGLNVVTALEAHFAWRRTLEIALAEENILGLQVHVISSENRCVLGSWIKNEAHRFHELQEYKDLCLSHAKFHRIAGEILMEIRDGKKESAAHRIKTDLLQHSKQVQLDLVSLCARVNVNPE